MGAYGIGSNLNLVVWSTALLLQEHPNTTVLLDDATAQSACAQGFQELLLPQVPKMHHGPAPTGCQTMDHSAMAAYIRSYTGFPGGTWVQYINHTEPNDGSNFFHQVSVPGLTVQAKARHSEVWNAMWHALCPVVQQFWQLAPPVQQHQQMFEQAVRGNSSAPVVAVHVRGGDKIAAGSREIPLTFDYSYQRGLQLVAQQLAGQSSLSVGTQQRSLGKHQQQPSCLLFGDDKRLMDEVASQAHSILNCSKLQLAIAAGSLQPWRGSKCGAVQTMLADMDTLAWADYTVGTMWSNFDAVAYYAAVCVYARQHATYVDGSRNPFGPYV
jgi:hypothetical protein